MKATLFTIVFLMAASTITTSAGKAKISAAKKNVIKTTTVKTTTVKATIAETTNDETSFTTIPETTTNETKYEKCAFQVQDLKLASTNQAWFKKAADKGFFVIEHGDCNNCGTQEAFAWTRPQQGRTISKQTCYSMEVTTKYGKYTLPMSCEYNVVEDQTCQIDFTKTDMADKLAWAGTIKIVATDNSTYIAGTTCLLERENFYWILSTTADKKLKPALYRKLKSDFDKIGFKKNNKAVRGKSPFFFEKLKAQPC